MNKINNFLIGCLTVVLMTGCNDAIDITQPGRLSAENAFQSVGDLQEGLFAVYNQFDITPEISLASNFTDEISIGTGTGGQGFALYDFVLNAASAAGSDFWVRNFRVNNRATLLIEGAQLVEVEADDQAAYNDILAQAYFIRAYANLEMMTYFSVDPRNDAGLSVPVIDFIPALTIQPRRSTVGELWDYINDDLGNAASLSTVDSSPIFVSGDAINGLRARAALLRGDYTTAKNLATQLLSQYPIANRTEYVDMFFDLSNAEVIFKLERALNDPYDGQVNTGSVATGGGWAGSIYTFESVTAPAYFEMDRDIFNALDPNDVRYDVNVSTASIIDENYETSANPRGTDDLRIAKYTGSESQPLMNDLKVLRSSEMLFIIAESLAYEGDFGGVATLLKQLRDARFGSPQTLLSLGNRQLALEAILEEKQIEFVFEGHRYRDLKRVGPDANVGIERNVIDCEFQSGACSLSASDFRFTLPIPIVELNANPGLGAEQNPGY
jgi:hypothetical protein